MTITQQQALHAVDRLRGAEPAQHLATLRQYIEQSTAQPQAVVPAPPQEFESAQGRALAVAWAEGWAQCRDAEYVGEDAQDEAFNQSATLAQCLHADQTRFQGGLSNDQLRRAWSAKLPNVIPTDEQLTAFALGIEAAAQPSAQAERAPVVQAREPGKYDDVLKPFFTLMERELHANSGKGDRPGWLAMKPDQALLEVYHHVAKLAKAVRDNDGPGIMEYGADVANMAMMVLDLCGSLAWVDAYRASSCAAQAAPFAKDSWQHAVDNQLVAFGRTSQEFANPHEALAWLAIVNMELGQSNVGAAQAVRVLTREELNDVALSEQVGWEPGEYVEAVQRKFAKVNGLRIPADGKIGSAA